MPAQLDADGIILDAFKDGTGERLVNLLLEVSKDGDFLKSTRVMDQLSDARE